MDTDDEMMFDLNASVKEDISNCILTTKRRRQKPKVLKPWSHESIFDLIEAIEKENSIWEYSSPDYKDRELRSRAWQKISKKFPRYSVDECKAKWANIKTAFQQTQKKLLQSKSGKATQKSAPHWPFWSAMQFCLAQDNGKKPASISTFEDTNEEDSSELQWERHTDNESRDGLLTPIEKEIRDSEPNPKKRRKRPKVTESWSRELILRLIRAIEKENSVWEYSSPAYKDRELRNRAWQNISRKFPGYSVEECKAKWANIKTVFLHTQKKLLQSKSGEGEPHWPYWSAMRFYSIQDCSKNIPSTFNFVDINQEDSVEMQNEKHTTRKEMLRNECPPEALKRALKYLSADEDDTWHIIGMYLASQMRELAKNNLSAANKLHRNLIKQTLDACSEPN